MLKWHFFKKYLVPSIIFFKHLPKKLVLTDIRIEKSMADPRKVLVWGVTGQNRGQNIQKLHFCLVTKFTSTRIFGWIPLIYLWNHDVWCWSSSCLCFMRRKRDSKCPKVAKNGKFKDTTFIHPILLNLRRQSELTNSHATWPRSTLENPILVHPLKMPKKYLEVPILF